jgi:hypothetical protein
MPVVELMDSPSFRERLKADTDGTVVDGEEYWFLLKKSSCHSETTYDLDGTFRVR